MRSWLVPRRCCVVPWQTLSRSSISATAAAALCTPSLSLASTAASFFERPPPHRRHPLHNPEGDSPLQRQPQQHQQQQNRRRPRTVRRTSVLAELSNAAELVDSAVGDTPTHSSSLQVGAPAASVTAMQRRDESSATSPATHPSSSSFLTSSTFITAAQQATANAATSASPVACATPAASLELRRQQDALRDAFTHARQHHNVPLPKDPRVYRSEVKAFRQSHRGRYPTQREVSPTVAVPLAPVSALKTLAHADRKRSLLHSAAAEAVLLHNAVVKNELVKSNAPQLVRCLRCFHVYTARPRTLWGSEVQQSGIEYERVQRRMAGERRLQRRPWLRKREESVGRRQRARDDDPTCCPQCGSPRAQWAMEYVHHHTHEKR